MTIDMPYYKYLDCLNIELYCLELSLSFLRKIWLLVNLNHIVNLSTCYDQYIILDNTSSSALSEAKDFPVLME